MIFWLLPLLFFFSADVDVDAVESISHQNKTARQVGHVISSESTEVSFLSFDFIFGFSTGHVGKCQMDDKRQNTNMTIHFRKLIVDYLHPRDNEPERWKVVRPS